MPQSGVHSVTVPGAVAGWSLLLERFGRTPLARLLEPAIDARRRRISGGRNYQRGMAQPGRRFCAAIRKPRRTFLPGRAPLSVRRRYSATPISRGRTARLPRTAATRSIAARSRAGSSRASSGAARRWPPPICLSSARSGPIRFRRATAAGTSSSCRRTAPASPR